MWSKQITTNVFIDAEIDLKNEIQHRPIGFLFEWSKRCDHAGIAFLFRFLWLHIDIMVYDCRHWDNVNNQPYPEGYDNDSPYGWCEHCREA